MPECYNPQKFKNSDTPVPCSKCPACLKKRISAWSFRLMQEEKISSSAYFLTLTYDTDHIPITDNGFMSFPPQRAYHLQCFFKLLRKKNKQGIKYYAAAEYGTTRNRPHYHIIIFNVDLATMFSPSDFKYLLSGKLDGKVNLSCLQWPHGTVSVGQVSEASVGYTLKYINKKYWKPKHKNDDRIPEFSIMSKGLGKAYLTQRWRDWHLADPYNRMYVNLDGGKKAAMPRYYKERIYSEIQRKEIGETVRIATVNKKLDALKNVDVLKYSRDLKEGQKADYIRHYGNAYKNDTF